MSKYFFEKLSGDNLIEKVAAAFLNVEIIPESKQTVLDNPDAYSHSVWEKAYFDDDDGEYKQTYKESSEAIAKFIEEHLQGVEFLFTFYKNICYDAWAFILYKKDGVLYEVNGSHCSCHGLENQWEPEETTLEALEHRATKGSLGYEGSKDAEWKVVDDDPEDWKDIRESGNLFAAELLEFIQEYREANKTPTVH